MICKCCGVEFETKKKNKIYCSAECREEVTREREKAARRKKPEPRACEWCGKVFMSKYKNSKSCSLICERKIANLKRHPDWYGGHKKAVTCQACGKLILSEKTNRKYCSRKCADKNKPSRNIRITDLTEEQRERIRQKNREKYRRAHPGAKTREQLMTEYKERRKATEEEKAARLAITYTCEICGKPYHTLNTNQKTCSPECSKRLQNIHRDHRIPKGAVIDRNISLASLYERDKGTCHICGLACDYNDYEIVDGVKKIGNLYPTIDHVIPLSRGGLHEWENVKLAHRICNSIKSADVMEEKLRKYCEEKELNPREIKEFDPRKKVTQATKDGQVVAVYESTAEAERQTGVKQRGIQKAARGEAKSYAGFVWTYA